MVCQGIDAPCIDLVANGSRWIIHPLQDTCCLLGTFAQGCGPLKRDWIAANNGTYGGRSAVEGVDADEWVVMGFSENKFWQAASEPLFSPVKMDQGGFVNIYNRNRTFVRNSSFPESMFTVPSTCNINRKCKSQRPCSFRI